MAERDGGRRAPYPAGGKPKLAPLNPGAALQEIASHAVLLAMAWFGGLGYLGTILVLVAEPLIVIGLSIFLYPQRGLRRHLWDLIKSCALMGFLLVFIVATYAAAHDNSGGTDPRSLIQLEWSLLGWALGYSGLHLLGMLVHARTQPNPRKVWARLALTQGAVTFIALFLTIFAVAFIGTWLAPMVKQRWPQVQVGDVLVLLAVLVRLGFALLMSRMPEDELDKIASNPYVD
jgi:hypothetical protein